MNNPFDLLIIIMLGGSSILAFLTVLSLLLPGPIQETQNVLEQRGGRSILLGLVNFVFFGLIVIFTIWLNENIGGVLAGLALLFGLVIALGLAVFIVMGLVALAQLLGKRMGAEGTSFVTIFRGGALLLLAGLAPYVGWFILTPLALWAGLGASISALVRRRRLNSST